jgi:hypothetical protein
MRPQVLYFRGQSSRAAGPPGTIVMEWFPWVVLVVIFFAERSRRALTSLCGGSGAVAPDTMNPLISAVRIGTGNSAS